MISKPHLAGSHVFKAYLIFISLIYCVGPKEANCGYLPTSLCLSPHVGMRLHMWDGVKEHDILYEHKSYKLKLLWKLVVQLGQYWYVALSDKKNNGWRELEYANAETTFESHILKTLSQSYDA